MENVFNPIITKIYQGGEGGQGQQGLCRKVLNNDVDMTPA
jgi:hypothetical protein